MTLKAERNSYRVKWNYVANDGRKAERYGPYLLQADLVRSFIDSYGLRREISQLGVISIDLIHEVSHRHTFWVITEAALDALELNEKTRDQIRAELSKVVPLPSESEIINHKNNFTLSDQ